VPTLTPSSLLSRRTCREQNLFRKITEQMIASCRESVEAGGNLWEQSTPELIGKLRACLETNAQYQASYGQMRTQLAETPKGKQFDFNENVIFGKFDLFCRRVEKLVDMFTTVEQFTALARHNLEGMDGLMTNFWAIVVDFKRKPYELLDFSLNQFDRDYLSSTPTSTSSRARCRASSTPPSRTSPRPSTPSACSSSCRCNPPSFTLPPPPPPTSSPTTLCCARPWLLR